MTGSALQVFRDDIEIGQQPWTAEAGDVFPAACRIIKFRLVSPSECQRQAERSSNLPFRTPSSQAASGRPWKPGGELSTLWSPQHPMLMCGGTNKSTPQCPRKFSPTKSVTLCSLLARGVSARISWQHCAPCQSDSIAGSAAEPQAFVVCPTS